MENYNFQDQKNEWVNCPVDDIAYIDTNEANKKSDKELKSLMEQFILNRYHLQDKNTIPGVCKKGWRNFNNLWRSNLIDDVTDKTIFDFGCGFGIESLQFCNNNNNVIIGDINQSTLELAERVLNIYNHKPLQKILITNEPPFFKLNHKIDIFYSNGVLHHTPKIREILLEAANNLTADGEIRLMLYSDIAWKTRTKTDIPKDYNKSITLYPNYIRFVRGMDGVGNYADCYNKEKIEFLFGDFLKIKKIVYITSTKDFICVILNKK